MKRYQVYLNPDSVAILDEAEKLSDMSRSKIIREAVDSVASNIGKVLISVKHGRSKAQRYLMDDLIGSIHIKDKHQTNYAQHVDDMYIKA